MSSRYFGALLLGMGFVAAGNLAKPVCGQSSPAAPQVNSSAFDGTQQAARRQVLESERWRQAQRALNEWLSIQQLYTPAEVKVLRAESQARIAKMTAAQLQDYLENLEAKLAVLSSPEAEDARRWLGQFLAVQAKYTPEQLRQKRPDVARMTASQIREELENFQKRRGATQRTQAASQQGRALQLQSAQNVQNARRQAGQEARERASQGVANFQTQRQNTPRPQDLPGFTDPNLIDRSIYTVGPWGNPILLDPRFGYW